MRRRCLTPGFRATGTEPTTVKLLALRKFTTAFRDSLHCDLKECHDGNGVY